MDRFLHAYVALTSFIATRRDDEEGATAVEYGLLVALIAVVIMGTVATLGTTLNTKFGQVVTQLN